MILETMLLVAATVIADPIAEGFANPPVESRPRVWWHWMSNFISRDGITKDLEAMAQAGIGGATIFDIKELHTHGEVKSLSDEWYGMIQHAGREADRLGLKLGFSNCPGWSSSGGPWIKPENAMKMIGWSETQVAGGRRVQVRLQQCNAPMGWIRDVAVVAFPTVKGDAYERKPYVPASSSVKLPKESGVVSGDVFEYSFAEPVTLSTVILYFGGRYGVYMLNNTAIWEVAVSEDGRTYRKVCKTDYIMKTGARRVSFSPVQARHVRITAVKVGRDGKGRADLNEVAFAPYVRVPQFRRKAMHEFYRNAFTTIPDVPVGDVMECPDGYAIDSKRILDLTRFMTSDGTLTWDAPAGDWTVLRFSNFVRKSGNHPVNPEAHGLECDKLSKAGVDAALGGMMKRIMTEAKAGGVKSFEAALIDSYEVGAQNWTDNLPAEYLARTGYDITKWLPALTGRYIDSSERTERFYEDFRKVLADLFAENYSEYFAKVCHGFGLQLQDETYCGPFDYIRTGRAVDVPMGEFWHGEPDSLGTGNIPGNIADVFGRKYVQTETFTAGDRAAAWTSYPGDHKRQGDAAYCVGVNRFVFHSYAHQPFDTPGAGITMGKWGFHFNRHNTLWNFYPGWLAYLARAQFLLQQGRSVADALYVMHEDQPAHLDLTPGLPQGYKSNGIDAQSFCESAQVVDGCVRLPSGMTYWLLVAADTKVVSAELLRKLRSLVASGANLWLGPKPVRAFGLRHGEREDREVAALANELWAADRLGKGRVWHTKSPGEVLAAMKIHPDFAFEGAPDILAIHRRLADREVYFVANPSSARTVRRLRGRFRAVGSSVEFWNAVDNTITPARSTALADGITEVDFQLPYAGSVFVVFRRDGASSARGRSLWAFQPGGEKDEVVADLSKDWRVEFQKDSGAPTGEIAFPTLTRFDRNSDFGIRHFSGTAVYRNSFDCRSLAGRCILELGDVHDVARVYVNGRDCGYVWTPPYRADVTAALKPGKNRVEIHLANRWQNRVIGDEYLPVDGKWSGNEVYYQTTRPTLLMKDMPDWFKNGGRAPSGRIAFSTARPWTKDAPLAPSGLEGPIRILHFANP